jgi:hypothetical protein
MLTDVLIVLVVLLVFWYYNISFPSEKVIYVREGFKPFEPDNILLNRNPFDDIGYIHPEFKIIGKKM